MCDTSSDNDSIDETSLDNRDTATNVNNYLLPEKSRKQYDKVYQSFIQWKVSKNYESFDENVLLAYFLELSDKFKSSTLYTFYSMLKGTLSLNHEVDLSKYSKLLAFLKRNAEGYKGKKSKTFSPKDITKFIKEAHDRDYLLTKVALIFGIVGGCRRHELYKLQFKDVQIYGSTILVRVNNPKPSIARTFTVTGSYYELCKKYMALRPNPCSATSFFLHYKSGTCSPQNLGINSLGALGRTIANFLELPNPELYTGNCFRRTANTILVDSDGDIVPMTSNGRWKSVVVPEEPMNDSMGSVNLSSNPIEDPFENNSNECVNTNFLRTVTDYTSNSIENNNRTSNQNHKVFENESIECVNINMPCPDIAEDCLEIEMETKDQVWNDIQKSFENKNSQENINDNPRITISEGYTSDSMESKVQPWHHVPNSVTDKNSGFVNVNIPSRPVPEGVNDNSKTCRHQTKDSSENSSNKVININVPGTSSEIQQGLSALVRFSNCSIQNVNIYYTK